jgi:hypothetical protein
MADTTELHGRLPDGHPCKLTLGPERLILEIAAHGVEPETAMRGQIIADPLVISLSNQQTATLRGNYPAGSRGHFGPDSAFVLSHIGANQVFVGPRAFGDGDLVDAISFRPTNEMLAQFYRAHRGHVRVDRAKPLEIDRLFSFSADWGEVVIDAVDGKRLTMCEFEQDNIRLALRISLWESSDAQGTKTQEARLTNISYNAPVTLDIALRDVMTIANFFSFVVGEVVVPTDIKIESGPENDFKLRPEFDLHIGFLQAGRVLDPSEAHRCLISEPIDGVGYERSLRAWMQRRGEWAQSYYLGSESLLRQNVISRHRYLDAVGWFESIPPFYQKTTPSMSREIICDVASAACEIFRTKGENVSESRLRDLLAPLYVQSLAMRLRAALAHLRTRFGRMVLPPGTETLISKITGLRGRLAHGENPLSSYEARDMHELILLVEAICGFLTLSELPWDLARLDRAQGHPMQRARVILFEFAKTRATTTY